MTIVSPKKIRFTKENDDASPVYALDDQAGFLLRVALRTHTSTFTTKMVEGLTPPQFSTLAKLWEVGSCSQNYLGRLIHYDSATITGVVNRLKKRGLIESAVDPLDRRRVTINLTENGRQVAERAIAAVKVISGETFRPLSAVEHATLTSLLKKIILR